MKITLEEVKADAGSSFKVFSPSLRDLFYWHFHPEYEIVYLEGASGTRHVGDHISHYHGSDLVFIGPNIPHLNFDYGIHTDYEQVVVQMKEEFLGKEFLHLPELSAVRQLFDKARYGLSFSGSTKQHVGECLKRLPAMNHFEQLVELLRIFQLLATTTEVQLLNTRPALNRSFAKEQERMKQIYQYIEANYQQSINVNEIAAAVHLTTPAFCRYFKRNTRMTFTDFVNQYRVNQAKNVLLQDHTVTEACYRSGFENLSHFNRTFRKFAGQNPSVFKKQMLKI